MVDWITLCSLASDLNNKTLKIMSKLREIYKESNNFQQFETASGLDLEDAKKYWSQYSKEMPIVVENLEQAMRIIFKVQKLSSTFNLYSSDMTCNWYFDATGYIDDKYFSFTILNRNGKIEVNEPSCADITLREISNRLA